MQLIFITGNLTADCEIVASKEGADLVRFTVAANDLKVAGEEKPTYYTCRMTKTGIADYLKKGRFVSLAGRLRVNTNVKDGKTYVNLDVWVSNVDLAPSGKD